MTCLRRIFVTLNCHSSSSHVSPFLQISVMNFLSHFPKDQYAPFNFKQNLFASFFTVGIYPPICCGMTTVRLSKSLTYM